MDGGARHDEGVGGPDDHPGGVLEQAGRECGRAQLLGGYQGNVLSTTACEALCDWLTYRRVLTVEW